MQMSEAALWVEFIVGVLGLVGLGHSAYRGTVRRAVRAVKIVPEIRDEVEDLEDKVDGNTDAILALVEAHEREDLSVDRTAIREELQRQPDEDRFLPDEGTDRWRSNRYPED